MNLNGWMKAQFFIRSIKKKKKRLKPNNLTQPNGVVLKSTMGWVKKYFIKSIHNLVCSIHNDKFDVFKK